MISKALDVRNGSWYSTTWIVELILGGQIHVRKKQYTAIKTEKVSRNFAAKFTLLFAMYSDITPESKHINIITKDTRTIDKQPQQISLLADQ